MTYSGFDGIGHARNFARKHFNGCYNASEQHSARAVAQGRGSSAYVEITKTDHAYKAQVAQYRQDQRELEVLQPLLTERVDDTHPTKRQKLQHGLSSASSRAIIDLTSE